MYAAVIYKHNTNETQRHHDVDDMIATYGTLYSAVSQWLSVRPSVCRKTD